MNKLEMSKWDTTLYCPHCDDIAFPDGQPWGTRFPLSHFRKDKKRVLICQNCSKKFSLTLEKIED